jgi:hypothetical protein
MRHSAQGLELPFPTLFRACREVLEAHRVPLHFRMLTRTAMTDLGVICDDHRAFRQALRENEENVREKFLQARWKDETFYLGKPHCLGGLRRWFQLPQLQLFHIDEVRIPGHAQAGATGAFHSLLRFPHMQQKNLYASEATRMKACATGLVLEAHVKQFFLDTYPAFFQPPENEHDSLRWDKNDFYLVVKHQRFGIDVFGPNRYGQFKRAPGKPATDIHIAASIDNDACVLKGVIRGRALSEDFVPHVSFSPINFLVWLNCLRDGLPYHLLTAAAA